MRPWLSNHITQVFITGPSKMRLITPLVSCHPPSSKRRSFCGSDAGGLLSSSSTKPGISPNLAFSQALVYETCECTWMIAVSLMIICDLVRDAMRSGLNDDV